MLNNERLVWILDLLVQQRLIHAGQKADVLNRGLEQARHIMLDKRAEMRRLLGKQRVSYKVGEIETIASFRFKPLEETASDGEAIVDERVITRHVAAALQFPFVEVDPVQLDYKLVTEAFGGPFAERHLVIALRDDPESMVCATADPWNDEIGRAHV